MARRYRILIGAAAVLLALPIVLCAALLVLAQHRSRPAADRAQHRAADRRPGAAAGPGGPLSGSTAAGAAGAARSAGTVAQAEDMQLNWWPLPLMRQARARRCCCRRRASPSSARRRMRRAHPPSPSSGLWLRRLRVDRLDMQRLELGAPLVGNPVALRLQGTASITSWQQASGQLSAQRLDEVPATYRVSLHIDSARVRGQLDLEEDADGPLTHLMQLPDTGRAVAAPDARWPARRGARAAGAARRRIAGRCPRQREPQHARRGAAGRRWMRRR